LNKELLTQVKEYIEENELIKSGEWGMDESLSDLIKGNKMPEIYTSICSLLN